MAASMPRRPPGSQWELAQKDLDVAAHQPVRETVPELPDRGVLGALTSPHEPVPQRTRRELRPFEKAPSRSCSLPPLSGWPSLSRQTAAAHKSRAEITLRVPRLNAVQSSRSGGAVNSSVSARRRSRS